MKNLLSKVYLGPMSVLWPLEGREFADSVYLDPGVYRGPGGQGQGQGHALGPAY